MGYNASILSVGTALYPAIGGALALAGWKFPLLLPLIAIPVAIIALFWLNTPEPIKQYNLRNYLLKTWRNINQKTVWGIFMINILFFVILYGSFLSYFPQLLEERFQASTLQIGLYMSGFSVITALTASQKKRINNWISAKHQLNISFILYFVSMLILSFAYEKWHLFAPLILFGLAHGILIPGTQTLLVGYAPLNERAGFMSINSLVLRFGQTTGPLFIGLFYAFGGVGIAFIGGAIVALIMLVISIFMVNI